MREIEAKFIIRRTAQIELILDALRQQGFRVTGGDTETLLDRYFDTPDWSIQRAGWSFRWRERGGQKKVTLKALGSGSGPVFVRQEIEQRLPESATPGAHGLPPGPVQDRLARIVNGAQQQALFLVRNRRTVYQVERTAEPQLLLELCVDRGEIHAHKVDKIAPGRMKFTELELELREGDPAALEEIAEMIRIRAGLLPAQLSKFERGIQTAGYAPKEVRAGDSGSALCADDAVLALIYRFLRRQLRELQRQAPRACEGLDIEGVHQMRIAIRSIRSVLRAFRILFPQDTVLALDTEFRWLAQCLGVARDADVCEAEIHEYRKTLPARPARAMRPYERHMEALTAQAYRDLADTLDSERHAALMRMLEELVARGPSTAVQRRFGDIRIADAADFYMRPVLQRFVQRGRKIKPGAPARKLHKLRLEGKRLRYLLEFFEEVHIDPWERTLAVARGLQKLLGRHQDACTAVQRLEGYAETVPLRASSRELLLAIGRLVQREEIRAQRCRHRFPKAWKKFEASLPEP